MYTSYHSIDIVLFIKTYFCLAVARRVVSSLNQAITSPYPVCRRCSTSKKAEYPVLGILQQCFTCNSLLKTYAITCALRISHAYCSNRFFLHLLVRIRKAMSTTFLIVSNSSQFSTLETKTHDTAFQTKLTDY